MALFSKAPEKNLIRDRDEARATRDRLALKLSEAETSVIATKNLAQRAALDGDDGGLDAAEAAEHAALRRLSTIGAAFTQSEKLLALLEAQIETMADQKVRAATAAAATALADELIEAGAAFDTSTAILVEVAGRAAAVTMEASGLAVYTASSLVQVAAATPVIAEVLRQHGRRVLSGLEPAVFPTPEKPFVADVVVQPVTKQVFCMKQVKWTTPEGIRFAPKYAILDLPPDVADRGLALKACTTIPGDEWATYKGTYVPFSHHREAINLDLDVDAVAEGEPTGPLYGKAPMSKAFGHIPNPDFVETIGPVRQMRIVAGGAA
jgi:hypothetical protein